MCQRFIAETFIFLNALFFSGDGCLFFVLELKLAEITETRRFFKKLLRWFCTKEKKFPFFLLVINANNVRITKLILWVTSFYYLPCEGQRHILCAKENGDDNAW